jgi:hypothetical protein
MGRLTDGALILKTEHVIRYSVVRATAHLRGALISMME